MRSRIPTVLTVLGVLVAAFLLITNPVVADAARTITGKDVKNGSLTGKDVKDRSLTAADLASGVLSSGAVGPAGPAGPAGATGPAGADGVLANSWIDFKATRDRGSAPIPVRTDGFYGDVVSLAVGPGQRAGKITVPQTVRLFINASALVNSSDASYRTIRCFVELRPEGGSARQAGFITSDDVRGYQFATVAVSASEAVVAGTYDVALVCASQPANPGGNVVQATMSVLALR